MVATLEDILNSHRTQRAIVMGVLNVTPDSFSDGGKFLDPSAAAAQAEKMICEGADIIDVGAESTRPGSKRVSSDEQIARLSEVLPAVARLPVTVSIDTTRWKVAKFALEAGAAIVNDVSAGRDDPMMLSGTAAFNAPIVLMHMLGEPKSMQNHPQYEDVIGEVKAFLTERIVAAEAAGLPHARCILDPGIGFGKLLEHNISLLKCAGQLLTLGCPVLIGPSRKRFIGELTGEADPNKHLGGTIAACLIARRYGASIFRVHDVAALVAALKVTDAIEEASVQSPRR